MLRLSCRFEASTSLVELEDFVVPIRVDVLGYDKEIESEYRVGYFAVDRILWQKAVERGLSLFEVCDCDSQGMHEMHLILTNNSNEIREDFELQAGTEDVVFVHGMVIHPDLATHRAAILNAVLELLLGMSLATIWQQTCDLTDQELFGLGFRKIAGEPLFARHWTFRNDFGEAHPNGLEGDFVATADHEKWIVDELKNRYGILDREIDS